MLALLPGDKIITKLVTQLNMMFLHMVICFSTVKRLNSLLLKFLGISEPREKRF